MNRYAAFMLRGTFTVLDNRRIPECVKRAEYIREDGKQILRILYNISDDVVNANGVVLAGDEMRFDIFDAETYQP